MVLAGEMFTLSLNTEYHWYLLWVFTLDPLHISDVIGGTIRATEHVQTIHINLRVDRNERSCAKEEMLIFLVSHSSSQQNQ